MTEKVMQREHPERAVYGGSGLWESCMKTIPEPRAEEAKSFEASPCGYVIGKEWKIRWNRALAPLGMQILKGAFFMEISDGNLFTKSYKIGFWSSPMENENKEKIRGDQNGKL